MRPNRPDLYLHEEILLLALRDERGTIELGSMYAYGVAGAILAELLLAERIAIGDDRRHLVDVINEAPPGEPLLDECLNRIAEARRRAAVQTWIRRFAQLRRLHHRVAAGLCERRILHATEDRILLIFRRTVYPEIDGRPERAMIERMRKAIFGSTREVDVRTVMLISLAQASGLLRIPFPRRDLKERKQRIEELTRGELLGKATRAAVRAAQAAASAAIVPAIAACSAG